MKRRFAGWAALGAVLALVWLGGLAWFATLVPTRVADADTPTDAIVVVTGGSLRVASGLALLAAAKAKLLFVSGVHPGVGVDELLRTDDGAARWACCVVLGHSAESTYGNALETASFMRERDFHSLRLVTASYHMPRALFEFRRAMPGIRIVPNPVFPPAMGPERWWQRPAGVALVAEEYVKYLVARVRAAVTP